MRHNCDWNSIPDWLLAFPRVDCGTGHRSLPGGGHVRCRSVLLSDSIGRVFESGTLPAVRLSSISRRHTVASDSNQLLTSEMIRTIPMSTWYLHHFSHVVELKAHDTLSFSLFSPLLFFGCQVCLSSFLSCFLGSM